MSAPPQNPIDLAPLFELDLEIGAIHTVGGTPMGQRVIADRDCVVTEGVMRMAYPGATLKAQGIEVDDHLRTTNPRIYAAGDCCMRWKFTHAADAAANTE